MTVAELGQRLSSSELSEWMAHYEMEPFGAQLQARQEARIGCMIVNTIRSIVGADGLPASEFLLTPPEPPKEMTAGEIEAALERNPFFRKIEA